MARPRKRTRVDSSSSSPTTSDAEAEPASNPLTPETEKDKFDKRFETATKSNDDVLGALALSALSIS
jgi:hypothetical protein